MDESRVLALSYLIHIDSTLRHGAIGRNGRTRSELHKITRDQQGGIQTDPFAITLDISQWFQ